MALGSLNNSLYTSLLKNKPSVATKLPGYGHVPGQKQSTPKSGSAWGGNAQNSLAANIVPNFTPQTPQGASYNQAQAGTGAPTVSSASAGGGNAHGDPRDPTYWTDVSKIKNAFDTNNADYNRQDTAGQVARDNALAALDKQQPIDTANARGQYNNAGLFYSSKLGTTEGALTSAYGAKRTEARTGYSGLLDSLNILRNQNKNENGYDAQGHLTGTNFLDALSNATGRQVAADQALAQQNLLAGLNADGTPKNTGGGGPVAPLPPGGMVNGQFQSQILSPGITGLINQWINNANTKPKATSGKAQKTTGR